METQITTKKKKKGSLEKNFYGYLFTAPFIIVFLSFSLYPILYTFYMSITNMTLMTSTYKFIGVTNFVKIFDDKFFWQSLMNTWFIWLCNFVPQVSIAMILAVWFNSNRLRIKYQGFFRTIFYLPNILMPATIAVLFFNLFSLYGPVNQYVVRMGLISDAFNFFTNDSATQTLVIFIQWWMWFGSTLIITMAGMTSISPSFYEAAIMDGANAWQMFTRITLPLLKPVLVYVLVTGVVGGMQMFDIPYMLTDGRGSPNGSIMTMNMLMYMKFSSNKGHIGMAAAVGVIIFVITAVSAFAIMKVLGDNDQTEKKMKKAG